MSAKQKHTVLDLFCGCGGLSKGFEMAGYNILLGIDNNQPALETFEFNHKGSKGMNADLSSPKTFDEIDRVLDGREVDVIIGGPPCQGFSSANQQRIIDDPRNELYKYFIKAVEKICPKFVVMENVKGMLSVADQVVEDYQNIDVCIDGRKHSYKVAYKLLNSVNFSVAQSRERLIYIAIRTDVVEEKQIRPEAIFEGIC